MAGGFSFIVSAILSRIWDNFFTKIFYFLSGLWYGFAINLSLAIIIFILFLLFFDAIKIKIHKIFIARIFLVFAIAASFLGVYNAFFPKVKNITIEIKNLPKNWEGKKIVHLSDVHLGKILGKNFIERISKKINEVNGEIIFITGDLFDGMNGDLEQFINPLNDLQSKKGIYYITGNHENYLGVEKALETIKKTKIKILDDEVVLVDGLQIIGVSYPNLRKDIQKDKNYSHEKSAILLQHAPTDIKNKEINHNNIYLSPHINFDYAKELGVDLQLSGHTHKGQIFPFDFITKLAYKGYDYGLHQEGDFSLFVSSGTGVWGPTMRTNSRSEIVVIKLKRK